MQKSKIKITVQKIKFKIIFAFLIIVFIFIFSFLILGRGSVNKSAGTLDAFAKCLTERGAVMYGAYWCPHCQNEKKAFGGSWRFVSYVECTKEPKRCLAEGVSGYPTWIFSDGKRLVGEQGIEKLSKESSCPLPMTND